MANLDAAQRQFVVKRIAQYCPTTVILSAFAIRWGVVLKAPDLAVFNPAMGGLLGPEEEPLFKKWRAEVDPDNKGIGARSVQLEVLNWQFLDCDIRQDPRGVAAAIDRINALPPVAGSSGGSTGQGCEVAFRVIHTKPTEVDD